MRTLVRLVVVAFGVNAVAAIALVAVDLLNDGQLVWLGYSALVLAVVSAVGALSPRWTLRAPSSREAPQITADDTTGAAGE